MERDLAGDKMVGQKERETGGVRSVGGGDGGASSLNLYNVGRYVSNGWHYPRYTKLHKNLVRQYYITGSISARALPLSARSQGSQQAHIHFVQYICREAG